MERGTIEPIAIEGSTATDGSGMTHLYPKTSQREPHRGPQVGDRAKCGWIKKVPNSREYPEGVTCVVCAHLAGEWL
jgi:hypothetical protein